MKGTVTGAWIIVSLIFAGCGGGARVTGPPEILSGSVQISGTAGKRWKAVQGPILPIEKSGTVPDTLFVAGTEDTRVSVTIRKDEPGGWTLTVCLAGRIVTAVPCATTTAEFGSVTVEGSFK